MVDQADIDGTARDGSLDKLFLGSVTTVAQEPKYFINAKENVIPTTQPSAPRAEPPAPNKLVLAGALQAKPQVAPSIAMRKLSPTTKAANLQILRDAATVASNVLPPRPPCLGDEVMPPIVPPAGTQRAKKGRVPAAKTLAKAARAAAAKAPKAAAAKRPLEPAAKSFGVITSLTASIGLRSAPEPSGQEANIIYIDVENDYALCVDKGARVEIIEEKTLYQADDVTLVDEHWLKISVFNFKSGWLKAKYVTKEPPKEPPVAAKRPTGAAKKTKKMGLFDEHYALGDESSDDEIMEESNDESSDESSDADAYDVECIVDERIKGKKTEFLVKWEGWSADDNTWEPLEHVQHCEAFAAWRARAA